MDTEGLMVLLYLFCLQIYLLNEKFNLFCHHSYRCYNNRL